MASLKAPLAVPGLTHSRNIIIWLAKGGLMPLCSPKSATDCSGRPGAMVRGAINILLTWWGPRNAIVETMDSR